VRPDLNRLRLPPTINLYFRTRLNRPPCETLLDEVDFIAVVSNDELLREHRRRAHGVVLVCVRVPQRELVIDEP
jgi:hypothetical protein